MFNVLVKNIKRNLSILLAAAAIFYLALSFYFDSDLVFAFFGEFNFDLLPLILLLALLNFNLRFLRWEYLLRYLNVEIKIKDSAGIFFSNLIMLATPGAMGELYKSYLVKKLTNEPMSKTAPIIFTERLNDFIMLTILSLAGAILLDQNFVIIIFAAVLFTAFVFILTNKTITLKILTLLSRIKFLHKYLEQINTAYTSFHQILGVKSFAVTLLMSFLSWMLECLSVYFVFYALGINVEFIWTIFAYAFSILFGSLTALPAGLGVTDGSLIFLISDLGYKQSTAVAAAIFIRLATLWFAVLVGSIIMLIFRRRFNFNEQNFN